VQHRARAVRRLSYRMMDLEPIAFAKTAAPQIISVVHGNVHWRGSASALVYSIERSGDLTLTGSWQTLCDKCASDTNPFWQDPAVPNAPVWYRMTPFNVNLHSGIPSAPVANR
jgi:mannan endo-1,4-beta-mannosidase